MVFKPDSCLLIECLFFHEEPIGSVSPKIHDGDKANAMQREHGQTISILCPAQAYPTPVFRYVIQRRTSIVCSISSDLLLPPMKSRSIFESRCFNVYLLNSHDSFS